MAMRYKLRLVEDLNAFSDVEPSLIQLISIFSERGYENCYLTEQGKITKIFSSKSFYKTRINDIQSQVAFLEKDTLTSWSTVDRYFHENPQVDRIVLQNHGVLWGEIENMVEPPLQNSLCKNLMALRYISIVHKELGEALKSYKKLLVLGEKAIATHFINEFPQLNIKWFDEMPSLNEAASGTILDFRYGSRLLVKALGYNGKILDFSNLISHLLLSKMKEKAKQKGVYLRFYKLPKEEDIPERIRSKLEQKAWKEKIPLSKLVTSSRYMKELGSTESERRFIQRRTFNQSLRIDDGYCFIQAPSSLKSCSVSHGIRMNYQPNQEGTNIHIFGPCTAYGILTDNARTVSSYLAAHFQKRNISAHLFNHGGLHGDNAMNSFADALRTPVRKGDVLVFFDVLSDFDENELPGLIQTKDWVLKEKSNKQTWFGDFPGHCSAYANKVFAKNIFEDLISNVDFATGTGERKKALIKIDKEELCSSFLLLHANPGVLAFRYQLNRVSEGKGNIGIMTLDGKNITKRQVKEAARLVDKLFVLVSGEKLLGSDESQALIRLRSYELPSNVKIILLPHYLNSARCFEPRIDLDEAQKMFGYLENCLCLALKDKFEHITRFAPNLEGYWMNTVVDICRKYGLGYHDYDK